MSQVTVHFEEYGGYDCMTDAWYVKRGDKTIAVLDLGDFDCERGNCPEAEYWARLIAARLNT